MDIKINREKPGENDQVIIVVSWGENIKQSISFNDCFELDLKMNFGVIAEESILDACVINKSLELTQIKNKWKNIGLDLKELKCFQIETNSTNSLIKIYALDYMLS